MILGYKQKFPWGKKTDFKAKILSGIKKHSFRKDPKKRWSVGMKIQQAIYRFRMQYHCFAEMECKGIQQILIYEVDYKVSDCYTYTEEIGDMVFWKSFQIKIDGRVLGLNQTIVLAYNDGFDSTDDFFRFFIDGFDGYIIHFTDLKY